MRSHIKIAGIVPFVVILYIFCQSCTDENTYHCPQNTSGDRYITVPESWDLDINGDSAEDFTVKHVMFTWDGIGIAGDGYTGEIIPLGDNEILYSNNIGNIFSRPGDTIFADVDPPFYWYNFPADIVSIYMTYRCPWPDEWTVLGTAEYDFYYLAFKVYTGDSCLMGWMKLTADEKSGEIHIPDYYYSYRDSLTIEE